MTTTTGLSKLMFKSFLEVVHTTYDEQPDYAKPLAPDTINTTQLYEELIQFEQLGPMGRMDEAGGIPFDRPFAPYNKKYYWNIWGIGWERSFDAEDTDQSGELKKFAAWAGQSRWWAFQADIADIFNYMTNTGAAYLGMNSKPLVSSSIPTKTTTFSNQLGTNDLVSPQMLDDLVDKMDAAVSWRDGVWTHRGPVKIFVADEQRRIMERIMETPERQGTADHDRFPTRRRIQDWHTSPFFTQAGYTLAVAANMKNLFVLKKGTMQYLQSVEPRGPKKVSVAFDRWGKGWRRNQGVAGSAGTL